MTEEKPRFWPYSQSFPLLSISKAYNLDYDIVLIFADWFGYLNRLEYYSQESLRLKISELNALQPDVYQSFVSDMKYFLEKKGNAQ